MKLMKYLCVVVVFSSACRYIRPDDKAHAREAARAAMVEALCHPPPPEAEKVERAIRAALCLAASSIPSGGGE